MHLDDSSRAWITSKCC